MKKQRILMQSDDGPPQPVDPDTRAGLEHLAPAWTRATWSNDLFKQIRWLGLPVQQLPEDLVMLQEAFWDVQPDVVIETGVAGGGGAIFWASLLAISGGREVVSVDVTLPPAVRDALRDHPLGRFVHPIEGDSVAPAVVEEVRAHVRSTDRVLVVLDSDHSRRHVLAELTSYADLVTPGSYVVVTDGVMHVLGDAPKGDPSWVDDNPLAAADEWLATHPEFTRDTSRERLLATYFPGAWLRREGTAPERVPPSLTTPWGEEVADIRAQCDTLRAALADAEAREAHLRADVDAVLGSASWRLGHGVVRPVGRVVRRLQGRPAPPARSGAARTKSPRGRARALSPASQRYLELLKQSLTDSLHEDPLRPYAPDRGTPAHAMWEELQAAIPRDDVELVRRVTYQPDRRAVGRDWPSRAETMIGRARLDNLQDCIETAIRDGIPGDLVETGVWRGGAAILMRAVLREFDDRSRVVWACDSFEGLPEPDPERFPADAGDEHWKREELAVSLDTVRDNFDRYGLLDDQVRFAKGWFEDTLPALPARQIAVLRLDGDMYGSTMVALEALEPHVPPGGFVIIDDYGAIDQCRQAVDDYRDRHGIHDPIETIDWTGAFWRKSTGR